MLATHAVLPLLAVDPGLQAAEAPSGFIQKSPADTNSQHLELSVARHVWSVAENGASPQFKLAALVFFL